MRIASGAWSYSIFPHKGGHTHHSQSPTSFPTHRRENHTYTVCPTFLSPPYPPYFSEIAFAESCSTSQLSAITNQSERHLWGPRVHKQPRLPARCTTSTRRRERNPSPGLGKRRLSPTAPMQRGCGESFENLATTPSFSPYDGLYNRRPLLTTASKGALFAFGVWI